MIKRTLVYCDKGANEEGGGRKTNWIMHEYSLEPPAYGKVRKGNGNMVLCGLYERNRRNEDTAAQVNTEIEEKNQRNEAEVVKNKENCLNLIKNIDHQSCDQPENLSSTAEQKSNLELKPENLTSTAEQKLNLELEL